MNIHLYSIKSLRNNFITLLYFHKFLNYESSSMRNDYILKTIRYRSRRRTSQPSQQKKKIENAKLSDIKTSSSIMITVTHYCDSMLWLNYTHQLIKRFKRYRFRLWNVDLLTITCYRRCATIYNNHYNIIIMTTFARLIITNYQVAIVSNFESFNIRLLSAIIMMLSKTEFNVEMCLWLIRKVCRERKVIRALTTHLHNMLFIINNQSNVSFITFNKLWARIAGYSFNYLSLINLLIHQSSARRIKDVEIEIVIQKPSQYEHLFIFNQIASKQLCNTFTLL